jgi:transposase
MVQRDITRNCNRIRRAIEFHGLESHFPNGAWGESTYRQAREKIATMDLSPSLKYSVATIFSVLETLWDCRKALRRELAKLSKEECYKRYFEIINSVPGIGPLTAMRLVLEWGDVTRFNRKEEFNNYTGLIPRDYSTGEQDHKGHITKQGCRWVRGWLIECAWVAIRHDPVLFDKFHRVVLGSGSKKKAIVAVARKMALRIRALLISGELYAIGIVK